MKKKKNKIRCDVTNCIYNNIEEGDCTLDKVKISSMDRGSECSNASSTLCQSFEKSSGNITDNEYEVTCDISEEEKMIQKLENENEAMIP